MPNCVNHPNRPAIGACRKCGKPICDQCSQETGRFCSIQCQTDFRDFQDRITDSSPSRRKRFSLLGCLKTFVLSIILIIVIWFALEALLGTSDPSRMLTELARMWRLAF